LAFILMVLPALFGVSLQIVTRKTSKILWPLGTACLVMGLVFTFLLINNYYRFYPTVGQIFNVNNALALTGSQKEVLLKFDTNSGTSVSSSVEGALNSIGSQPTEGKVYSLNIPGKVSKFHARGAYVYVPAIYTNPTVIDLPVLVLTAGFPGLPENWLGSGLQSTMDSFAKKHDGITPLVFMVDNSGSVTNDTECVDGPRGNAETYLTTDVPNYIKANFNVIKSPDNWAIGGLSMGGMCSIMLALRHPDTYHYFIDLGGEIGPEVGNQTKTIDALFSGSFSDWQEHQPLYLLAHNKYKGMGGFFGLGKEDQLSVTDAANQLSIATQKAGIETISESIQGQHTFDVWQETFKLSLPWVSNRIGATQCGTTCL
jgi:enterochelin esterase-like enzyme